MKLAGLVLLLAAAVVSGQKCCTPDQYMAGNGQTVGISGPDGAEALNIYQYGAWDFANRMIGLDMGILYSNGTYSSFRLIQKYAEGAQWVILEEYGYCEKQPSPKPEPTNCVPANATLVPGGYIGGEKGIFVDSYNFFVSPPQDPILGSITFSGVQGSCLPVGSTFVGKTFQDKVENDVVSTSGWLNVTIGIPEPAKWFDLPPYCKEDVSVMEARRPKFVPDVPFLSKFRALF